MAPKPCIETLISKHWYWKPSYQSLSYPNIDIENIKHANHIEPNSQIPYRTSTTKEWLLYG